MTPLPRVAGWGGLGCKGGDGSGAVACGGGDEGEALQQSAARVLAGLDGQGAPALCRIFCSQTQNQDLKPHTPNSNLPPNRPLLRC